jgi:hypothetical protein
MTMKTIAPSGASRTRHLLTAALLLATPATLAAQSTPGASGTPSAPHDPLKNIPLAGEQPLALSIGGQARWREEFYRGFNTLDINDDNSQTRLLLSADVVAGHRARWYARGFGEVRDDQSYGRTLPGGARTQDEDRHDIQTLHAEVGHGASFVRVGRQEIALAQQRLIGVADWSNTRRSSQGARVQLVHGPIAFEAVDARPVLVRQQQPNRADSTQRFRTLSLGNAPGAKPVAAGLPAQWQAYWYEQTIRPTTGVRSYRLTAGGRVQWSWGGAKAPLVKSFEVEAAAQRGTVGVRTIQAHFWVAEGQLQWKRLHGTPSLAVGVEQASGENPHSATTLEAFNVLYPAAHAHGGYADVIGRTNTRELHSVSSWDPLRPLNLRLALYRFDRVRLDDAAYTKQNTVFRAAGMNERRHIADELDLTGTYKVGAHWRAVFGGGVVAPGAFLNETATAARTERWGFTGVTVVF